MRVAESNTLGILLNQSKPRRSNFRNKVKNKKGESFRYSE